MRKFLFILVPLFCRCIFHADAQEWIITGKVIDASTGEPLPFVNVFIPGTTRGTITDIEGKYTLKLHQQYDTIAASLLGYDTKKLPLSNKPFQTIDFSLSESAISLKEIVVTPGENPAHILLRKIIANKSKYNKERWDYYKYEVYNKIELDLDNITDNFTKRKLISKKLAFLLDYIDSTSEEKPYLPAFLTETISDYYYRKNPKASREYIKASRVSGVNNESIAQFLGTMYQEFNIYENWISVLGKGFLSPIADNALNHYKYYLVDSGYIGNRWCYKLEFKPSKIGENTFHGYLWINDSSYAIVQIEMHIPDDANINFIEGITIYQEFSPVNDSIWMLTKDRLIIDFVNPEEKVGLIGRKTTTYRKFVINDPSIERYFEERNDIILAKDVYEKPDSFWVKARHEQLSENEKNIYEMIDTLKNTRIYNTYETVIQTVFTGWYEAGPFDLGPYFSLYSYNVIEGHRVSIGLRTNEMISKRFRVGGYAAYGFEDKDWKYGADALLIINKNPRIAFGAKYVNDLDLASESPETFGEDNILAGLYRRRVKLPDSTRVMIPMKRIREEIYRLWFENDWGLGISTKITASHNILKPYFEFSFLHGNGDGTMDTFEHFTTSELNFNLRFAYREKFITSTFERTSLGTKYPVLNIDYTIGLKNILHSDFNYHKISVSLSDKIPTHPFGNFHFTLQGGKIFGTLPAILLEVHPGNETWFNNPYAFNMMNQYEFISDMYASLYLKQDFDGYFFNRIPGIRKLKLREVIMAKAVIGTMSGKNKAANAENRFLVPYPKPYVEAGGGIENIFQFFTVHAYSRITYRKHESIDLFVSNWGIRLGMKLQF